MPPTQSRSANDTSVVRKRMDKFLRLLTIQMVFIIALLAYMILNPPPQAGQYQVVPAQSAIDGTVIIFDTITGKAGGTSVAIRERGDSPMPLP